MAKVSTVGSKGYRWKKKKSYRCPKSGSYGVWSSA